MAAQHATGSGGNGDRFNAARTPFPRFQKRRREAQGWIPVDLGGHEVVARLHMRLKRGAQAAGEGRHALDRLDGSIDDSQLAVLRLLVTELVTNSVRHADSGDKWIGLEVEIYSNAVRVIVSDRGPGFQPPAQPEPHPDRPGGWGLCLLDRLADRWGVLTNDETSVWFEMDRAGHGLAPA